MKPTHWIFPAMVALTLSSICLVPQTKSLAGDDDNVSKINDLPKQRRETLRQLVKGLGDPCRVGRSTFDSVIRASDQLVKVEFDLAEGQDARLAIDKQRVELQKTFEKMAKSQFRVAARRKNSTGCDIARMR